MSEQQLFNSFETQLGWITLIKDEEELNHFLVVYANSWLQNHSNPYVKRNIKIILREHIHPRRWPKLTDYPIVVKHNSIELALTYNLKKTKKNNLKKTKKTSEPIKLVFEYRSIIA